MLFIFSVTFKDTCLVSQLESALEDGGHLNNPFCTSQKTKWKWSSSLLSESLGPPWTIAYEASPSMGFSRQEYWSGVPLPSPHILVKYCSKFSKPSFSNTWTVNFQMFLLVLEKAEEPEIKLPTSAGSSKKQESSRKTLFLLHWLCQSLCVDHNKLWKILKEMGIPDHLTCLLRNLYAGQEATVRTGRETTDWFQ